MQKRLHDLRKASEGDPVFIGYLDAERTGEQLPVQIKNPSGSMIFWEPYDRKGYTKENIVRILFTSKQIIHYRYAFIKGYVVHFKL